MTYILPDASSITLGNERFLCPQALFTTHKTGIPGILKQSILMCDNKIHQQPKGNIVLAGGTSLFKGLKERISKELDGDYETEIIRPQYPIDAHWIRGSILASHPTFRGLSVTHEQYHESGPVIVHSKCTQNA